MPIHDWTRVDAGVFHGFHLRWIAHITERLNTGGLPKNYYADAEQHAEKKEADVLTLHASDADDPLPILKPKQTDGGKVALLAQSALAERTAKKAAKPRPRQRRVVIRHVSGHRVVAFLEIVSPGNKDRRRHAVDFAAKLQLAVESGVHVTTIDLFPPTRSAPRGLHNEIWRAFDRDLVLTPPGRPLALAAFVAKRRPQIFFDFRAVGDELPTFPIALDDKRGAMLPLAETYAAAFAGSPPYLRELLSTPA